MFATPVMQLLLLPVCGCGLPGIQVDAQPHPGELAMDPDGKIVARSGGSLADRVVSWFPVANPKDAKSARNGVREIPHLIVRGDTVCTWSPYGEIVVFDVQHPSKVVHIAAREFGPVALSPTGRRVAFMTSDQHTQVMDWRLGKKVARIADQPDHLAFLSDDVLALQGFSSSAVTICDLSRSSRATTTANGSVTSMESLVGQNGICFMVQHFGTGANSGYDVYRWVQGKTPQKVFSRPSDRLSEVTPLRSGYLLQEDTDSLRPWRRQGVVVDDKGTVLRELSFLRPVVRICCDSQAREIRGLAEDGSILSPSRNGHANHGRDARAIEAFPFRVGR